MSFPDPVQSRFRAVPSMHGEPVGQTTQSPVPMLRVRAADAVVGHLARPAARSRARRRRWRGVASAYLATFVSALGHHEVGGQLDRLRQPLGGQRRPARPAPGRGSPASRALWPARDRVSTAGWMPRASSRSSASAESSSWPAVSSSWSAASGSSFSFARAIRMLSAIDTSRCWAPSCRSRSSRRRSSRPMRSIRSRERAQLVDLRAQLGLEPLVHERERGGGADRPRRAPWPPEGRRR